MNLSNGAIKEHIMSQHRSILSRDDIVSNTEVLHMQNDTFRLLIHEAVDKVPESKPLSTGHWLC